MPLPARRGVEKVWRGVLDGVAGGEGKKEQGAEFEGVGVLMNHEGHEEHKGF